MESNNTNKPGPSPKSSTRPTTKPTTPNTRKPATRADHQDDHVRDTRTFRTDTQIPARPASATATATATQQQDSTRSTFEPVGPANTYQVTNYPGGYSHTTLPAANPSFGFQQPYTQQASSFAPQVQVQAPALFYQSAPPTISPGYYYFPVSTYFNMEERSEYTVPNQVPGAQNYTENPVPSLARGPMIHEWHPRFDGQCPQQAFPQQAFPQPAFQPMQMGAPPQMQTGFVGQPVAMHPMVVPGQPQQHFAMHPGVQAGQVPVQPGPPAHVMGHPSQFLTGQPGQFMQTPGAPQGGFQYPGQPGGFQQVGGGVVNVANLPPDIMGIGRTRTEFAAEQAHAAMHNEANEPQDFQPADPNPGRMYWCRQLDNEWVQMSRATIDNIPSRWYVWPTGVFYAIRLEE